MKFQFVPYIIPLFCSSFITMILGIYSFFKRESSKCALIFALSMFVVTIWSFGNVLEMAGIDLQTKLFWANIQYFAYCYSPVTLLAISMQFTGYDSLIKNKKILWFALIPTIIIILIWTDRYHGLMRYDIHMDYVNSFPILAKKYGPIFIIHAVYSHCLNISAAAILIKGVFFDGRIYKKQAIALFIGLSLIVVPNILYIIGIAPIKKFDITPVFFGPAGLIIALSIFRYKMFDVVPLARAKVFETMDAGVMVLDLQNRILDINPAFEKIVGLTAAQVSIKDADIACKKILELAKVCADNNLTYSEFSINNDKVYEVYITQLSDLSEKLIGRLVLVYEITEKKKAQKLYLEQQQKIAASAERERLARDLHDNLGQVLGFINLQAQGIKQELSEYPLMLEKLDKLINAAQSAHKDIREYIKEARNTAVNYATANLLTVELQKELSRFNEQSNIKAQLIISTEFEQYEFEEKSSDIINIIREALNNVRKHSEASNVIISISKNIIKIEDNGKGFVNKEKPDSFGLKIMKERAGKIGAVLDIKTEIGRGSCITLELKEVVKK